MDETPLTPLEYVKKERDEYKIFIAGCPTTCAARIFTVLDKLVARIEKSEAAREKFAKSSQEENEV